MEAARRFFDFDGRTDRESPFMLLLAKVREDAKASIPAVVHADGTARAQTVRREDNPLYHELLSAFERLTDCAVLVNTSFNVRGEPIVCTPAEAFACFMRTEMDCLVIGDFILLKSEQGESAFSEDLSWQEEFQLD